MFTKWVRLEIRQFGVRICPLITFVSIRFQFFDFCLFEVICLCIINQLLLNKIVVFLVRALDSTNDNVHTIHSAKRTVCSFAEHVSMVNECVMAYNLGNILLKWWQKAFRKTFHSKMSKNFILDDYWLKIWQIYSTAWAQWSYKSSG